MRDPTHLLATRESVARPWSRKGAPPVRPFLQGDRSSNRGRRRQRSTARTVRCNGKGHSVSEAEGRETIERGVPGASARAEYERRHARDEARRRARYGCLAPVVSFLAGPKVSTEAWARGAEGEERVGPLLDELVGRKGFVLHDRRVPGRRLNLDHLVVMASGAWVIDTKHYHGRLSRRRAIGWFNTREVLMVGRRNQNHLIDAVRQQRKIVEHSLQQDIPVRAALCFTGVEVGLFARAFIMDDVTIAWPNVLARSLRSPGVLTESAQAELAERLAHLFPPYRQWPPR
jgi:hypothetical protein